MNIIAAARNYPIPTVLYVQNIVSRALAQTEEIIHKILTRL